MTESTGLTLHPVAPGHFPFFVTPPGSTDVLFWSMVVLILLAVIGIGVFYFKLHSLPEQMAHNGQKIQFEIVAVLALLALFTHNHLFWIAGLLLALVPIPDFSTPLTSMATSLGTMAGRSPRATGTAIMSKAEPEETVPAPVVKATQEPNVG